MAEKMTERQQFYYDNFEKLLGKNGELVEYRKKQVLEGAFGIIRRHYEDKPNKIEAIAQMFGKKLNEDFKAVIWDSIMECRFTNEGLEIKMDNGLYRNNGNWLSCLLTGEAKIVEDKK